MSATIPSVQKAWCVVRRGAPAEALVLDSNVPVPKAIPAGSVLVKIHACALNPAGYKLLKMIPIFIAKPRRISEYEFAGEVIDANGTAFNTGDHVFGVIHPYKGIRNGQGALASYAFVDTHDIVTKPSNLSLLEASGLASAGLTAYHALFVVAQLEPGQSIFINGGSSSVGAYAIQMAKSMGCKVYASASGKNEQFVRDLGADDFFDYTAAPLHEQLLANPPTPKFHTILEAVGLSDTALYTSSEGYLAPNGIFVSSGPQPDSFSSAIGMVWQFFLRPRWAGGTKRAFKTFSLAIDKAEFEGFQKLVTEGKVKPVIDSVYKFEDAMEAYDKILTGRAKGKIIIEI